MLLIFFVLFVLIRALIGWDVNVSKNGSYVPRFRTRILAFACLPVLVMTTEAAQSLAIGSIAYLLAFAVCGVVASKRRTPA